MLREVLKELETAQTPVTLNALSRKLGIEPQVLEAMLEYWVRQGRLQESTQLLKQADDAGCAQGSCGSSCHGPSHCSFIAKIPRAFSLVPKKNNN